MKKMGMIEAMEENVALRSWSAQLTPGGLRTQAGNQDQEELAGMNQRETGDLGQGSGEAAAAAGSAHHHRPAGERLIQYGGPDLHRPHPVVGRTALTGVGVHESHYDHFRLYGPHRHGRGHPASIFPGPGGRAGAGEDPGQLRHWCGVGVSSLTVVFLIFSRPLLMAFWGQCRKPLAMRCSI